MSISFSASGRLLISYMAGGGTAYTVASVSYGLFGGVVAFLVIRSRRSR